MLFKCFKYLSFIALGSFIGVFFSNYEYFHLNEEISLGDLIALVITTIVGLYIADTIQRQANNDRRERDFIIDEIQAIKEDLKKLSRYNEVGKYPFNETNAWFKAFNTSIQHIQKLLEICKKSSNVNTNGILDEFKSLRKGITSISPTPDGFILLDVRKKNQIERKINSINQTIYKMILDVNSK